MTAMTTGATTTQRDALLDLHQALLADARADYERAEGRLPSNGAFLQLVLHDGRFGWLGLLAGIIARLDESATARRHDGTAARRQSVDPGVVLEEARVLLAGEGAGEFAAEYAKAIQRSADVAWAAGCARRALGEGGAA